MEIRNVDIKELAEVYDLDNEDSFISLYIHNFDERFIEKRSSACKNALKKKMYENFEKTMEIIYTHINKNRKHGAIFASYKNNFFKEYEILPSENLLVVDSSPYIKPIVKMMDEYDNYGLVLINSHKAKIYIVSAGKIEHEKNVSKTIMSKHKKGGWSQARFQRIRKGAINQFLKEAAEDTEKIFLKDKINKIVVAGPGEAKIWFKEHLPKSIQDKIIDIIDESFHEMEPEIISDAGMVIKKDEEAEKKEILDMLKKELLKNGLAVHGIEETIKAAEEEKIDVLLVGNKMKIRGWKCERCNVIGIGIKQRCPYCGHETTSVDVVEEVIELAERSDARIEFFNGELKKFGGIAALLRYK